MTDDCPICALAEHLEGTEGGADFMARLVQFVRENDDQTAADGLAWVLSYILRKNLSEAFSAGAAASGVQVSELLN